MRLLRELARLAREARLFLEGERRAREEEQRDMRSAEWTRLMNRSRRLRVLDGRIERGELVSVPPPAPFSAPPVVESAAPAAPADLSELRGEALHQAIIAESERNAAAMAQAYPPLSPEDDAKRPIRMAPAVSAVVSATPAPEEDEAIGAYFLRVGSTEAPALKTAACLYGDGFISKPLLWSALRRAWVAPPAAPAPPSPP